MKRKIFNVLSWLVSILIIIWIMFPIYWALITSLKPPMETSSPYFLPFIQFRPVLTNWITEFSMRWSEIGAALKNSLIVSVTSAILVLLLGSSAGYALARFKYKRIKNQTIAMWILGQRILPPVVVVVPLLLMAKNLHMIDNQLTLIIVYTVFQLPFGVIIMMNNFREIPVELEEAAFVDGSTRIGVFLRINLPLALPAVIATILIAFAFSWNDLIIALALTYSKAVTVPVMIGGVENAQGIQFWIAAVRTLIAIAPPVLLTLIISKYMVRGLTFGAIKG